MRKHAPNKAQSIGQAPRDGTRARGYMLARAASLGIMSPPVGRLAPSLRRTLCVNMRKVDGSPEDAFFRKQERARLDALKAKKAINEADENVRLARILDTVIATDGTQGVRLEIREALKVQLLLWKHDQDVKK